MGNEIISAYRSRKSGQAACSRVSSVFHHQRMWPAREVKLKTLREVNRLQQHRALVHSTAFKVLQGALWEACIPGIITGSPELTSTKNASLADLREAVSSIMPSCYAIPLTGLFDLSHCLPAPAQPNFRRAGMFVCFSHYDMM